MTRNHLIYIVCAFILIGVLAALQIIAVESGGPHATSDPRFGTMIAGINESEILRMASDLQNIPTRVYPSPGNREAADYLYHRLASIPGLEVAYQGDDYRNIIATLPGKDASSGEVVVVGAHYDSISSDPDDAPGATDNGCGVGIVLELAHVMSEYQFNRTIQFALWNAEEDGQKGSADYIAHASESGVQIPLYQLRQFVVRSSRPVCAGYYVRQGIQAIRGANDTV